MAETPRASWWHRVVHRLHRVVHRLHWQRGWPEVQTIDGVRYVGFQCSTCGLVSSLERCPEWLQEAPHGR